MNSILKNVVYLNIITDGQNYSTSEIIEIAIIKVIDGKMYKLETLIKPFEEVSASVFGKCKNLKQEDLDKAPTIYQVKKKILDFIEDYPIIIENQNVVNFLEKYILNERYKNIILDTQELAMILEPYHREYNMNYLIKNTTNLNYEVENRAYKNVIINIYIINALLTRLYKKEENTLDRLYFNMDNLFSNSGMSKWRWSSYIKDIDDVDECLKYVIYKDSINKDINNHSLNIRSYTNEYEELLKEKEIWSNSKDFSYIFRPRQYEFTKFIRQVFNEPKQIPKIGCIEAPTGIGKSVGYLVPAIMESLYNNKNIVISTDTKNLQMQLINKDIPAVLKSMNLLDKVSYGCMKGKNNYLCKRRIEEYQRDIIYKNKDELLQFIFIQRLINNGEYGDIEEISQDVFNRFLEIDKTIYALRCESDICYPEKCFESCFYKNRIQELPKEHITVINHSLLAKWPYKEKKPLDYLIIDEGHNLMEKSFDFFTSECSSMLLNKLLEDLYPHNDVNHRKISTMDKFFISIKAKIDLDPSARKNLQANIDSAKSDMIQMLSILSKNLKMDDYDHTWEVNRQEAPLNLIAQREKIDINFNIKSILQEIISSLREISRILKYIIDQCEKEKEDESYLFNTINSRSKDLDEYILTMENFIHDIKDGNCRIIDVSHEYKYFNIKIVPIDVAELFESMFLSSVDTVVFLSATLNISSSMKNFKTILGLDKHDTTDKTIESIYDYEGKTKIIGLEDFPPYNALNNKFIIETANLIKEICLNTNAHVLALFTSMNRLEKVYNELLPILNSHNIELYKGKNNVSNLRVLSKNCVVLASKSCFEGVDIPGEGLTCVILDKLPNKSFDDPLYSSIRTYKKQTYDDVNYPQLSIKAKQVYGRLIRSKYDYGYFIILDPGKNNQTIRKLQTDLHDCEIKRVNKEYITQNINKDFKSWKMRTLKEILKDIKVNIFSDDVDLDYINKEISKRNLNLYIKSVDKENKKLKIASK